MSKLNLTALLLGVALFTGLGAVSLSASSKCGAENVVVLQRNQLK